MQQYIFCKKNHKVKSFFEDRDSTKNRIDPGGLHWDGMKQWNRWKDQTWKWFGLFSAGGKEVSQQCEIFHIIYYCTSVPSSATSGCAGPTAASETPEGGPAKLGLSQWTRWAPLCTFHQSLASSRVRTRIVFPASTSTFRKSKTDKMKPYYSTSNIKSLWRQRQHRQVENMADCCVRWLQKGTGWKASLSSQLRN